MQSVKYLLDTHTLLWTIGNSKELSKKAIREIKNPDNEILASAVSLWEIAIKYSIGKLEVDFDINKIPEYCNKMGFRLIPLEPAEALECLQLPQKNKHKDPFDRMIIYQCIKNKFTLISTDDRMKLYKDDGLNYIW
jgi:PIN domain nuclease of toxin-antitoxin system